MPSFTINRESFAKALQLCERVVPAKGSRVCLRCVKIEFDRGHVLLTASDLEATVEIHIAAETQEKATVLIPCNVLRQIVAEATSDQVSVILEKTVAKIVYGFDEFEVSTSDAKDFPEMKGYSDEDPWISAGPMDLQQAIKRALIVAPEASEQGRHSYTGICLRLKKATVLHAAAIAGTHFCYANIGCTSGNKPEAFFDAGATKPALVPNKFCKLLMDACGMSASGQTAQIIGAGNQLYVKIGDLTLSTLLIQATFPDYERVLKMATATKEVRIKVADVSKAMSKARIMVNEETSGVVFNFEESKLTIRSMDSNKGKGKVEIPCELQCEDPQHETIIRYDIVADAAKMYGEDETAVIEMDKPASPVTFRHKEFVFMLSPITGK